MSRIFRLGEMYHQQDSDVTDDLTVTVAADALAIPVTHLYVAKSMGADAEALTLANGKPGQLLVVNLVARAGTAEGTLTPATKTGWSTVVFLGLLDQAIFLYIDDIIGWILLGVSGTDQPPVVS